MRHLTLTLFVVGAAASAAAQEQADPRTLTPSATLNAIAQRISGAQARNHVYEMCPYERNRPAEEYQGTYRESAYAESKAKEYGFAMSTSSASRCPQARGRWRNNGTARWPSCGSPTPGRRS
jgi:hypothetical protein